LAFSGTATSLRWTSRLPAGGAGSHQQTASRLGNTVLSAFGATITAPGRAARLIYAMLWFKSGTILNSRCNVIPLHGDVEGQASTADQFAAA